jgi:NADPH:quinone reductase-like Zn-dependent oxidoreductase
VVSRRFRVVRGQYIGGGINLPSQPNHEQLIRIGDLLESGVLHPVVDAVLPLTQASAAYTGEVRGETGARKAGR